MEKWQIILLVILALNGFWLFTIACLLASIGRHVQEQADAMMIFIGTLLNLKENDNDTTEQSDT